METGPTECPFCGATDSMQGNLCCECGVSIPLESAVKYRTRKIKRIEECDNDEFEQHCFSND